MPHTGFVPMIVFPHVGPMELVVILALALIIFGPGKLPQVGRAIGKAAREFKESISPPAQPQSPSQEDSKSGG